jgi:hypothetical protein
MISQPGVVAFITRHGMARPNTLQSNPLYCKSIIYNFFLDKKVAKNQGCIQFFTLFDSPSA